MKKTLFFLLFLFIISGIYAQEFKNDFSLFVFDKKANNERVNFRFMYGCNFKINSQIKQQLALYGVMNASDGTEGMSVIVGLPIKVTRWLAISPGFGFSTQNRTSMSFGLKTGINIQEKLYVNTLSQMSSDFYHYVTVDIRISKDFLIGLSGSSFKFSTVDRDERQFENYRTEIGPTITLEQKRFSISIGTMYRKDWNQELYVSQKGNVSTPKRGMLKVSYFF